MKYIPTFVLFFVLIGSMAHSIEFISNKSGWDDISNDRKHGFVMGYMESETVLIYGADQINIYKSDISDCMVDLKLHTGQLIEIIDSQYSDLSNWDRAPAIMLSEGIREVCFDFMNHARAVRGDDLLQQ